MCLLSFPLKAEVYCAFCGALQYVACNTSAQRAEKKNAGARSFLLEVSSGEYRSIKKVTASKMFRLTSKSLPNP